MSQGNKRKLRIIRDPEHQLAATFVTRVCTCGEEFTATTAIDAMDLFGVHEDIHADECLSKVEGVS